LRPHLRLGVLGHHQPRGLGGLRVRAARAGLARSPPGTVRVERGRGPRVHGDGGARVRGRTGQRAAAGAGAERRGLTPDHKSGGLLATTPTAAHHTRGTEPEPAARPPPPKPREEGVTMPFDMSLVQRGARNRRTPYYEATQRYEPKGFTVYNHMYFPIRFDTFEAEFEALLNDVTLWDVSVERCLEIGGPDGFAFAQLLTPRNLSTCAVGQAKYVLICDSDGGIINDPVLTRMDENTFWFALASSDALLFARGLKNAYPNLDVTIRELDVAPLQIQGPKSKALMRDLVGESIADLKYYWWRHAEIAGIPVVVTRTGWTSEVGYEVYLTDPAKGTELWEAIMAAGAKYGIRPTGPSDIRRI